MSKELRRLPALLCLSKRRIYTCWAGGVSITKGRQLRLGTIFESISCSPFSVVETLTPEIEFYIYNFRTVVSINFLCALEQLLP